MTTRIAIIDTGAANLLSVAKAVSKVGGHGEITSEPSKIDGSAGAILPGVGANDAVMNTLNKQGLVPLIKQYAKSGRPLLCICLGMQILFESSEEGELAGLGMIPGSVKKLSNVSSEGTRVLKVPHMGWNTIQWKREVTKDSVLEDIPDKAFFYFVHSFHCVPTDKNIIAGTTQYGNEICSAIIKDELVATQFHPEKSGSVGLSIYQNFVRRVE